MMEVLGPLLGVLVTGALLVWFWRPRRGAKTRTIEKPEDLWKAMDDDADPTE